MGQDCWFPSALCADKPDEPDEPDEPKKPDPLALADALAAAWLTYKDAQIAWDNLPKASSPVEIRIETATRLTWATERMDAAHDAFLAARRREA